MVLLEVVARIPEPMRPPTNVGLLKLCPFNRSYDVQFSSTLKPLLLKLFLSSTATKSYPHQGIKVWWRLAFGAVNSRSDFVAFTPRPGGINERGRQALSLTYVDTT